MNDNAKSSPLWWIISYPHAIQSTIANDYITVEFDDVIRVMNTELR